MYRFRLVEETKIEPRAGLYQIKIPDSTPEIVGKYALGDEQALLAKVRYNRLIDVFTGVTTYSLQNHLTTAVDGVQVEVDEVYVGVGKTGAQFIIPVQAKGGADKLGRVQLEQDLLVCGDKFPGLICRPIAAQFMGEDVIALFEVTIQDDAVRILDERHYCLVPYAEITADDLKVMREAMPA